MKLIPLYLALLIAGGVLGYAFLFSEPNLPSGPLVAAIKEAREPEGRRQNFDAIFDRFVSNALSLEDRVPLLEAEGFRCTITQFRSVEGDSHLACQRPLEGQRFCEGFSYYAYQTREGVITNRIGTDFYVAHSDRDWDGGCAANEERYYAPR